MEKLSGPIKAKLQADVNARKTSYTELHSQHRNRDKDSDDEEYETPFRRGIGPNPRALRVFRNACTTAANLIGMKETCLEKRAQFCVTDFVTSLC